MADSENRVYDLIDKLAALYEDGIPILPGRIIIDARKLHKIIKVFPDTLSNEIQDARAIIKKQNEIIEEAQMRAEKIVQDAENERYKLLNESAVHRAMEEKAEQLRKAVNEHCEQIKMAAFNEAQESRLNAQNELVKMREDSQEYAQVLLNELEQAINKAWQSVKDGQTRLQEIRSNDNMQRMNMN